jgi:hypothetical protein
VLLLRYDNTINKIIDKYDRHPSWVPQTVDKLDENRVCLQSFLF